MFEDKTQEALHEQMLEEIDPTLDTREGSIAHVMTGPPAVLGSDLYMDLNSIVKMAFASTSATEVDNTVDDYLNMRTEEMGVSRKAEEFAKGVVTFSGPEGIIIEASTRVYKDSITPVYFVVTTEGTIPSTGSIILPVQAELGGLTGNVGIGQITGITGNLVGTVTVTNEGLFEGGVDRESDQDLYARYLERVRTPITSGNPNHYKAWAKEVIGVGDAKVYPVWDGDGTVKVELIDSEKTGASAELVNTVRTYIESVMPVGPELTVVSAIEVPINLSAIVALSVGSSIEEATNKVKESIKLYLRNLAYVDPVVRYNQLASFLLDTSNIVDFSDLMINGDVANITISEGYIAVLGEVTLTSE